MKSKMFLERRPTVRRGRWAVVSAVALCLVCSAFVVTRIGWGAQAGQDHIDYAWDKYETNPGISIYGDALSVHADTTGVVFGPFTKPGPAHGSRYIALLKYPSGKIAIDSSGHGSATSGGSARSESKLTIDGKTVTLKYEASSDQTRVKIARETLTLNGVPINLKLGSVLLIDLTSAKVTWRQANVEIPHVEPVYDPKAVEHDARRVVRELTAASSDVRAFLR